MSKRFHLRPGARFSGNFALLAILLTFSACSVGTPGSSRQSAPVSPTPRSITAETNSVETLTARARDSIVVITQYGRDGAEEGVGAGFIIATDGLIATSLHVIGEGRRIRVRLHDGRSVDATEVHAFDRKLDLAILRVDAGQLRPLRLGDSDMLKQGAAVVAIGNPLGLEHSVVQGVLSARRDFDGIEMLQLAIPIEPGNSGGPLLDMKGRVHGILTLKSAMTRNLGFAMPVNLLKTLVDRPNPVPMARWMTLGAVNPRDWTTVFGAHWSQRAGRITVDGSGKGFGGRSLCLSKIPVPGRPFEIAVEVRLEDESGAAGLAFGSDGSDRHYGFYPSAGQLRLTRFDGPNVYSWNILRQVPTPHYRRGDWNHLRVRVEADTLRCYVNDQLICEAPAADLPGGQVGLAKFRDTRAQFRGFQISTNSLAADQRLRARLPEELAREIRRHDAGTPDDPLLRSLQPHAGAARIALAERARELERQALRLRRLAADVHRQNVQTQLVAALAEPEATVDLFHAALLVALHDNVDLDVDAYRIQLRGMSQELVANLPEGADDETKLKSLREFLFTENGFHGSRTDYYNRANSYINQVLDDREGLPITLAVLFIELARALDIKGVAGVPLPGHFMVKYTPEEGAFQLIDVFEGGKIVSRSEAQERVFEATGEGFREEHLEPASKRDIIVRMLHNLQSIAERSRDTVQALHYADLLVAISSAPAERLTRVRLRLERGERAPAKADLKWLIDAQPGGIDVERLEELYESLGRTED